MEPFGGGGVALGMVGLAKKARKNWCLCSIIQGRTVFIDGVRAIFRKDLADARVGSIELFHLIRLV
jgi:hypothetical protein